MKLFKKAFIAALPLTLCGTAVNLFFYLTGRLMPLAFTMYGGECIIDFGFGLRATYIYSMTPGGNSHQVLSPDLFSLIVCLAVITLAVWLIMSAVNVIRKRKSTAE